MPERAVELIGQVDREGTARTEWQRRNMDLFIQSVSFLARKADAAPMKRPGFPF